MKRLICSQIMTLFILSLSSQHANAQQASGKYYVQLDGGLSIFSQGEANNGGDIEYEPGFTIGGRLGTKLAPNLRAEGDVSYSSNEIDDIEGVNLDGFDLELNALTFGIGIFYDFLQLRRIKPYIGAGIGGVYKVAEADGAEDDEEVDLTLNGEIGAGFDVTSKISLVPHYRLLWLDDVGNGEQLAHWLRLGIRFTP